jgi:hypothetical protein
MHVNICRIEQIRKKKLADYKYFPLLIRVVLKIEKTKLVIKNIKKDHKKSGFCSQPLSLDLYIVMQINNSSVNKNLEIIWTRRLWVFLLTTPGS